MPSRDALSESRYKTEKARHTILAIRAIRRGLPWVDDGKPVSQVVAASRFRLVSRASLQRTLSDARSQAAIRQIEELEIPEDPAGEEMAILARSLYSLLPQKGGRTVLTAEEEFALVQNAIELSEKGFSVNAMVLKQHALLIASQNHPDSPVTKRWSTTGVSHEWLRGFMSRWKHLISARYGEGIDGGRRQLMYEQVIELYRILEKLGEEVGEDMLCGKRRLSPRQLCNLDETCMRMQTKEAPVIAMKGAAKALYAHHKNNRDSHTLVLTVFADGVSRVAPFLIVNGKEGDPDTLNQPSWWGSRGMRTVLHGTMMEHAAVAQQKNAYMTNAMFITYVRDCMIPQLQYDEDGNEREHWVVLMLDNFGAHITSAVLRLFKNAKIHVVGLAPHSSELCQPLDLCINSALKKAVSVAWAASSAFKLAFQAGAFHVQDWIRLLAQPLHPEINGVVTGFGFAHSPLDAALSKENCISSFRQAGITLDQVQQYHPDWLRDKFDEQGILKPCNAAGNARQNTRAMEARKSAIHRLSLATEDQLVGNVPVQHIRRVSDCSEDALRKKVRNEGRAATAISTVRAQHWTNEAVLLRREEETEKKAQAERDKEARAVERAAKREESKRKREEEQLQREQKKKQRQEAKAAADAAKAAAEAERAAKKAERQAASNKKAAAAGRPPAARKHTKKQAKGTEAAIEATRKLPAAGQTAGSSRRVRMPSHRALEAAALSDQGDSAALSSDENDTDNEMLSAGVAACSVAHAAPSASMGKASDKEEGLPGKRAGLSDITNRA